MIYKQDFDITKKYWRAFWEKELIDRPPICVTAPKDSTSSPIHSWSPTLSYQACMKKQYDALLESFNTLASSTYYAGEALPFFEVTLGPDQYAAFLGAEIIAKDEYYTTWVQSNVDDWQNFNINIDKAENGYYAHVKDFMSAAAAFSKDKFFIGMLDLHSNLDALSALRGPQNLCLDLIDCPEQVHRVLNETRKTYSDIFNMAYIAGEMESCGSIGWAPTYCEHGKFAVLQCDFSCMISPQSAREFVIPAIREEAAFLDRCVYHYDGKGALGHLEDILAIEDIDVIQWVPGDGQPRSLKWMDLLKKIQKSGKSLWIYDWTVEEIKMHFKELEPNKVVFSTTAASRDEADELLEYVRKHM